MYQDETAAINKIKIGPVKPFCGERLLKRDVGGRKVTMSVSGEIIKMVPQQKMGEIWRYI